MQKNNAVEVKNLTKVFKKFRAVDGISFEIASGEILGLLGPNGAGKTTIIQMLLGLLTPTSGSIEIFGKDITKSRTEIMEQVNFSSTYVEHPYQLGVKQILNFTSHFYKIKNRKARIEELMHKFHLSEIAKRTYGDLSAGQKTRFNFARALLNSPQLLILDEPTASLDPDIADYIRKEILEISRETGMTVLFTSHNMSEVEMVCDRVIFLRKGHIVANDTPENLKKNSGKASLEEYFLHLALDSSAADGKEATHA